MQHNLCSLRILALTAALFATRAATAECANEQAAKLAYERGISAARAQNLELALRSFKEANEQCPNPVTQLATAIAYAVGGKPKAASEALEKYIMEAGAAVNWCSALDTRRQIAGLDGTAIHPLSVRANPGGVHLTVREARNDAIPSVGDGCPMQPDGEFQVVALPPGRYIIRGTLDGAASQEVAVEVTGPTTAELSLQQESPQAPVASPTVTVSQQRSTPLPNVSEHRVRAEPWHTKPESWVWIGSGAVAAASIVTGAWALSLQGDLNQKCGDQHRCSPSEWGEVDRHQRLGILSTAGFVIAGTGALVGVGIHFLTRPTKEAPATSTIACSITPNHVAVDWRF